MRTARPSKRFLSLVVAAACAYVLPALAADFEEGVPLSLAKALLWVHNATEPLLYNGIPEDFPQMVIPPEFTVQGGVERGHSRQLVLRTDAGRDEALDILSGALTSVGFLDVEALTGRNRAGFLGERDLSVRTFCRDDAGMFGVTYVTFGGGAQVILNATGPVQGSGFSSCADIGQPPGFVAGRPGTMTDNLSQHMPVMALPADVDTSRQSYLGMSGGSSSRAWISGGATYETSSEFGSDMTIPQLYQHFAQQIGTQGWALDSEASGQLSASGNWIKIPDADTYLHGAFNILQSSQSKFMIRFRLTKLSVEQ